MTAEKAGLTEVDIARDPTTPRGEDSPVANFRLLRRCETEIRLAFNTLRTSESGTSRAFSPVMTLWASLVTAGSVTTSLFTPVTGTVNVTTDAVQVIGSVHVVSRCLPTDPCQVYVNLVGVTGEGQATGQRFLGRGAVDIAVPPNPIVTRALTFALLPVGSRGLPPNPIQPVEAMRVTLTLEFGTTGELLAVSALASTAPPPGGE